MLLKLKMHLCRQQQSNIKKQPLNGTLICNLLIFFLSLTANKRGVLRLP